MAVSPDAAGNAQLHPDKANLARAPEFRKQLDALAAPTGCSPPSPRLPAKIQHGLDLTKVRVR